MPSSELVVTHKTAQSISSRPFAPTKEMTPLMKIVHFLNQVHAPLIANKNDSFQCTWIINKDGNLECEGPSIRYLRHDFKGVPGRDVKEILKTNFSQVAQDAGFDAAFIVQFNKYLITKDHKAGCDHLIKDSDFLSILAKLAQRYENAPARKYAEHATGGALSSKLPLRLSFFELGKFVSVEDAAILAQINRASREQAKIGKALDESRGKSLVDKENSADSFSSPSTK